MKIRTIIFISTLAVSLTACSNLGIIKQAITETIATKNAEDLQELMRAEQVLCQKIETEVIINRYRQYSLRMAYLKICSNYQDHPIVPASKE